MRSIFLIGMLFMGILVSWTMLCFGDFYVVPSMKKNYAPVARTGQTPTIPSNPAPAGSDGDLQKGVAWAQPAVYGQR